MKKSTLVGFSVFTLVMAIGTFWWGVHLGREHVLRETSADHQGRVGETIRLLGGSDIEARDTDSRSKSSDAEQSDAKGNKRTVEEVMAQAMALPLDGLISPRRMAMASDLLKEVDDKDLSTALKWVESEKRGQSKQILRMILLSRWAGFDGPGAANYVLENPGEHPQGAGWDHTGMFELKDVISNWVGSDPAAALEWYERNADKLVENAFDVNDGTCLTTIFEALSVRSLDEALVKLESLEGDRNRMYAMTGMFSVSDTQRRGELVEKLESIEDPLTREEGYKMLMSQWASLDPEEAAVFVDNTSDLDSDTEKILMNAVGTVWMANHPEEGAKWLAENATEENRSSRMLHAVSTWMRQDPDAAANWLAEFEPSPAPDDALTSVAMESMHRDSESRFEWGARITDDTRRNRVLELIFQQWHSQDSEQAKAYLRASDVPPDQSAEWIEQAERRATSRPPLGSH